MISKCYNKDGRRYLCNNADLFYKTMWKYIFVTEILKEIYGNRKKNWLEQQMLKWSSDSNAMRAYKFLLENDELDAGLSFNKKIESKDIKFYINPCYYRAIKVTFY